MIDFEVRSRDGFARVGRFWTPHGTVDTPALLPVVHPDRAQQSVPPEEMRERFGLSAVISSAYIAWRSPALRAAAERDGVHALLGTRGPVFTDSGAFQQHAYGHVEVRPEEILDFQGRIGSDITTVLDIFVEPGVDDAAARAGVETTLERARAARAARSGLLAVPVQGGLSAELRRHSAEDASRLADVLAVGGVVPLLERYRFADVARVLLAARPGLAPEQAVHLFGTGHPLTFAFSALFGVDLFDSAAYHKFARRGDLLFPEGTIPLERVREPFCSCALCGELPLDRLAALPPPERERAVARHNLLMSAAEVRRVRQAIHEGSLWELAERRAGAHPAMTAALRAAAAGGPIFFPVEPDSRGSFREVSALSRERPAVARFRERLARWRTGRGPFVPGARVPLVPDALRQVPATDAAGAPIQWEVPTEVGPVPLELTELYPVGCWVGPEEFDPTPPDPAGGPAGLPAGSGDPVPDAEGARRVAEWTRRHVSAVLGWSYPGHSLPLDDPRCVGLRSRRTGRLREVAWDGRPAFRLGDDGVPRPTWLGATLLHGALPPPANRVTASADAVPFVEAGRSLFSRFVRGADPGVVPGQSVLLVDEDDRLLAVGRAELSAHEMGRLLRGTAVTVTAHARGGPAAAPGRGASAAPAPE